jgi:hypothetical protein
MFDTARKTSSRFGRPAKLVLTIVAAFTLLTGGAALADESTSAGTQDSQATAAESLLQADNLLITETETTDAEDAAKDAAEASAEASAEAAEPAEADGAQGVHGTCVSKAAQDKSAVGRDHGLAVSKAAHECPKGSGDSAGKAKGAEKSAAAKAKRDAKSLARKAHGKS